MKRRNVFKLIAAGIASPFIPASTPRCDAAILEARVAAGESIVGETFYLRRTVILDLSRFHQTVKNCHFDFSQMEREPDGPLVTWNFSNPENSHVGWSTIRGNRGV